MKMLNLKLLILLEYRNIKTFLQNVMFQIGLKTFLLVQKLNFFSSWKYVISDLKSEKIVGTFYEKELHKRSQKGDKLYVKSKGYDNSFNSCIDKV